MSLRRLFKSRKRNLGEAKFIYNKFYFNGNLDPVEVDIPKTRYATVSINGENAEGKLELHPEDKIKIEYKNNTIEKPNVEYKLEISKDNNTATLHKNVTNGVFYEFEDIPEETSSLNLKIAKKEKAPEQTDIEDLYDLLRFHKLKGEFLDENIAALALSEINTSLDVVISKKPKPGKPAGFELIEGLKDGDKVEEQSFFATFVEETPGEKGFNVFGEELLPEDLSFFPNFGENVLVEDRGLLSLKPGRIVFNPYDINIIEENKIDKAINWEDGLVVYEGDIVINGDVKEGAQIKCTGNLTINGGVYESYVFSDGDITINGNSDQSVIYSGFCKMAASNIEKFSLQYLVIIERVMFETSFSADDGTDYSNKAKSLELATSEFNAIKQSTAPFETLVNQFGSEDIIEFYSRFDEIVNNAIEVTLNDLSNSEDLRTKMEDFYAIIDESKSYLKDEFGNLRVESGNSAHLFSYMDTHVDGSGTYQSNIESLNSVFISGTALSTNIEAPNAIEINQFNPGNANDASIHLTKRNGHIKVSKLSADSIIKYEDRNIYIDDEIEDAYFDKKNLK